MDISSEQLRHLVNAAQTGRNINNATHDLNNMLGVIMSYADLIQMDTTDDEINRMLSEIIVVVEKSAKLLDALTTVARKPNPKLNPQSSMNDTLNSVKLLFNYEIALTRTTLNIDCEDALEVKIPLPTLQRILMHLVANAQEALVDQAENNMTIQAKATDDVVLLTVSNSGLNIPEDIAAQMFNPGFTTKGDTHPGMGLPTARTLAQDFAGDLIYTPSQGFKLTLPIHQ